MKQIYDDSIISQIKRRIWIEAIIIIISLIITFALIFGLYLIKSREYVIVFALISALILTIEIIFVSCFSVFRFLYNIEFNRMIKNVSLRKPETITGIFTSYKDEKYTYKRVTFNTFEFDFGDSYRGEKVYRSLYLEQDQTIDFKENHSYKMDVVDNYILSYEEV
ncbi:MAG: hypothetical protein K6G38_01640 [Gammaproteobacteria bacterium]|nr:hypothetical protein [Gammaproteobacteria bacterium]